MQNNSDYILIIHTDNDIVIEEVIDKQFDVNGYAGRRRMQLRDYEVISKREFNERLDRMLVEY